LSGGVSAPTRRRFACVVSLAAALALLTACGNQDDSQELNYTIESQGKWGAIVAAPEKAEAGLTKITLDNESDVVSDLQLIRVEGDHTREEVVAGFEKMLEGAPLPDWFFAAGGVGALRPDENVTVEQVLRPGKHYAFNLPNGVPAPNPVPMTKVTGLETEEELEGGDVTITASEYRFKVGTFPSGDVAEITFENAGAQPHQLIIYPLKGDADAEDIERFFATEKGPCRSPRSSPRSWKAAKANR